ncbi:MAG: MMPL family transporter [Pirellulaceae bacterium]|nr:MMPL family transporter [Pirellulaceae bacterium]
MLLDLYANLFLRHRWVVTLFVVVMTALATWGHLRETPSPLRARAQRQQEQQSPRDSDSTSQLKADRQEANQSDDDESPKSQALLVVESEDFFRPSTIDALRKMVTAVEDLPAVASVIWLERLPITNMFGVTEPLIPPSGSSQDRYVDTRRRVLEHPLAVGQLISADGQTMLMPIVFDWLNVESDADCTEAILVAARGSLDESGIDGMGVKITGDVPLFVAQNDALHRSQMKFQVIGYLLALVVTIFLFRGVSAVLIVASAPAAGIFWSIGLLNLLGHSTNTLTNVILPVLVSMIGLTDGVHLMMHIRECRTRGLSQAKSAREAILRVGMACALTSLTTCIGFGSLMVASAEFIRDFGEACAIGVVVSFCAVVTLIPLLSCTVIGRHVHVGHANDLISHQLRGSLGFVNWTMRHPRIVTALAVLLTIGFGAISLTLRPDNVTKNSLPNDSEMYAALAHCDDAMGGIDTSQVVITWPDDVQADDPRIFHLVESVQTLIDRQPLLKHPLSICDLLATFPTDDGDLSTKMSFLELLPPPLKALFVNDELRQTIITFRIRDDGIAKYEPVFRKIESQFASVNSAYPGFQIELSGESVRRSRDLYQVVVDLAKSLGVASVVIFVVITLVYRSLRIGLISIIPNVFPLVFTGTVLVMMGGALDFASVCAFTVCLGIAVDDTIHFLTRFEKSEESSLADSIRSTYLGVGTAMVTTTVILVLGFGTALTSELPDHRMFAGMACATIAAALVGDLLFLPAMLVCFPAKKDSQVH